MSKVSTMERNKKRKRMIEKYSTKRENLKSIIASSSNSEEEKFEAMLQLAKLPRNSSATRYRIRCELSGRGRGNYREFLLSRNKFRELASRGHIPGVFKASW